MTHPAKPKPADPWLSDTGEAPEPGYWEWLEEEFAAGLKDVEEGRVHSHDDIRKMFGLV